MSDRYSRQEAITAVSRLDDVRLVSYLNAEIVTPLQTADGPIFRKLDIVRLELVCELSDQFDLQDDALAVVMSLVDQLHGARAELRSLLDALSEEPQEVQDRICAVVVGAERTATEPE